MRVQIQVLSESEKTQVHERSLNILAKTGVRVDTERGRRILHAAGASVDESNHMVRLPPTLVEEALRLAPREFSLGGRRPGFSLPMNAGNSYLLADGGAVRVHDSITGERRPGTYADWLKATRLLEALDDVSVYWQMVEAGLTSDTPGDFVAYWRVLYSNYSKHIQEYVNRPDLTPWLLEVLQTVFGGKETVSRIHPISFLLCPFSPLVIEGQYTDAYLETTGWNIPAVLMPMPLMGTTSPASLISTILLGNCEVLAMLCLVQAACPGTPAIYAPMLAVIDPHSGQYNGGAVEHCLLGVGATEMARYYNLPVEAEAGGSDAPVPGIQAGYERALNWELPTLARPDILVGPGLLGGSTVLCLEQLMIDLEMARCCQRIAHGIDTTEDKWLDDVIARVGAGGSFLTQRSTRDSVRAGEWYFPQMGFHDSFENWVSSGRHDLLEEARLKIEKILSTYPPNPPDEPVMRELQRIEKRARCR